MADKRLDCSFWAAVLLPSSYRVAVCKLPMLDLARIAVCSSVVLESV